MSNVEIYLSSPQAVAEMAAHLAEGNIYRRGRWSVFCPGELAVVVGCSYVYDDAHCEPIRVYFRPRHGRYVVTDAGEAARAYRFRTGETMPSDVDDTLPDEVDVADGEIYACSMSTCHHGCIDAADLPRALCRVLLAAYRVSRLEAP